MITGLVAGHEARVRLIVQGPRRDEEIEAVIDTGYTAFLTLPLRLIKALGLRWKSLERGILADGSECLFDVYEAVVAWDRRTIRILANEADTTPLVGMALLHGYELAIQVRAGGKVILKRLPSPKSR